MENARYLCVLDETGKQIKFELFGRMDTHFINNEMSNIMTQSSSAEHDIVLDLNGVEYISSSFLRLCLAITKEKNEQNRKLSVVRLSPPLKQVFKIAGFGMMLSE